MKLLFALFARFILRDFMKNRIRSILTVCAVALGVAVFLSINLANSTALSSFSQSIDLVSGKANLEIRPVQSSDLDENILSKLSWLQNKFIAYTPVLDEFVQMSDRPFELVQVLGVDMFADNAFRSGVRTSDASDNDFTIFKLGFAYIGEQLAKSHNLSKDSKFQVLVNDRIQTLTVAGVLTGDGIGAAFSGNLIVMDMGPAQALFDLPGRIARIELIVPEEQLPRIQQQIREQISTAYSVDRPSRRSELVEKMLRSFQYNLVALSLIALLVAAFLIYNTVSIAVIRRRWELGTLRALGVRRRTILCLFLMEAGFVGCLGSLLGLGLGVVFAQGSLSAVSKTVQSLYADQPLSNLTIEPSALLTAFLVGLLITVGSAIAPSLEAISIAPAEATRRASYERKVERVAGWLLVASLVQAGIAYWCALQPAVQGFPVFGYAAAAFVVFAAALATPSTLKVFFAVPSSVLRFLGIETKLAVSSLRGAIGRTSVTIASLMVGIAMMVSLAIMIGSFRQTVITWIEQTLKADLWIEPAIRRKSNRAGALSARTVDSIRTTPGVKAVDSFVEQVIEYNGQPTNLGAGELDVMAEHGNLPFVDGEPNSAVMRRTHGNNAVVVSEPFAIKHDKRKGDLLTLETPKGPLKVKIEGIYYDYSSDLGFIVLPRNIYGEYFNDTGSTSATIFLGPGQDPEKVRSGILERLGRNASVNIRTNVELKREVLRVFDNTFAITYSLHAISITVAILGVANSLLALVMESRRELGILKYLGTTAGQIKKLVLIQSALLGAGGCVGGFAVGLVLSQLLIHVINKQSFGWTIQLSLPWDFLLQSMLLIMACALGSGLLPARLASATPAPEVVRSE